MLGMVLLILTLVALAASFRLRVFESVFVIILTAPILIHLIGIFVPITPTVCIITLLFLFLAILVVTHEHLPRPSGPCLYGNELYTVAVFLISFFFLHRLCLRWPDFISIGERIRDYAILSSVVNSPIEPREPWMAGVSINYYLYWYRLAQFFSVLLGLEVWRLYHLMVAFTFALYLTSMFRLFTAVFNLNAALSIFLSCLIAFGSNVSGVCFFSVQDSNWWGPSRVISGAINEFPAWSFLLGDLHPHFQNLALAPFLITVMVACYRSSQNIALRLVFFLTALSLPFLWLYNANAWELPVWLVLAVCLLLTFFVYRFKDLRAIAGALGTQLRHAKLNARVMLLLMLLVIALNSLLHSSQNILSVEQPITFVSSPYMPDWLVYFLSMIGFPSLNATRTSLAEIFLHWGLPLTIIPLALFFLFKTREMKVTVLALTAGAILSGMAFTLLIAQLILATLWLWQCARSNPRLGAAELFTHGFGLAALLIILFPEFFFFNDSYGGENERMNTIFKFYSASWTLLHVYASMLAVCAFTPLLAKVRNRAPLYLVAAAFFVFFGGFFYRTIDLRQSSGPVVPPPEQGLSALNRQFPGAAAAIQKFETAPMGVTLEAQGPPYSNTTHVATLAGKTAYLGWANHVELLTRRYDEIKRRKEVTDTIYRESNCAKRSEKMSAEGIYYLVLGPLEKGQYPGVQHIDYSCLPAVVEAGEYKIFRRE